MVLEIFSEKARSVKGGVRKLGWVTYLHKRRATAGDANVAVADAHGSAPNTHAAATEVHVRAIDESI